jgi:predicted metalloprotease with PDZ domain
LDPGRLLRVRKDEQPCAGTEIAVRLEHAGSGTRVTVVQSGFGPWLPDVIEMFGMVWNMIVADLKLYIERGITLKTHLFSEPQPTANLGCSLEDNLTGLVVVTVNDDGFAARAGIQQGDLLVNLNGVRLLNGMQLLDLMRMCKAGDELNAVWARGRERMEATAAI